MSPHVSPDVSRVMKVAARPSIVMVEGRGSWIWDADDKRYLDFVQGWAVNCLGHSPRVIVEALESQARRLINASPAFYNEPMAKLATLIAEASGLGDVFLCNSGAEANEGAIKLARKWGARHRGGAFEIITMEHAFHGRTLATMSASGKPGWDTLFEPKVPGFPKVPLGDLEAVRERDHAHDHGGHARADPGRGRRAHGRRRLAAGSPATDAGGGHPPDRRRDPDRHRPHGPPLRV